MYTIFQELSPHKWDNCATCVSIGTKVLWAIGLSKDAKTFSSEEVYFIYFLNKTKNSKFHKLLNTGVSVPKQRSGHPRNDNANSEETGLVDEES